MDCCNSSWVASSEAVRAAARLHVKVHHASLEYLPLAGQPLAGLGRLVEAFHESRGHGEAEGRRAADKAGQDEPASL